MGWRGQVGSNEPGSPEWSSASSTDETTVQPLTSIEEQITCEFLRLRKRVTRWGTGAILVLLMWGTATDYRSCARQEPVRRSLRGAATYWRHHGRPELARDVDAPRISCMRIPPGQ